MDFGTQRVELVGRPVFDRHVLGAGSAGDRIAFELPVDFVEQDLESMQIDNAAVDTACKGQHAAFVTVLTKGQARNGVRVFRVTTSPQPAKPEP